MSAPNTTTARAGYTLIEILVVAAVLGVVMRGIVQVLDGSSRSYRDSNARMNFESRGARLFDRLLDGLRQASDTSLAAVPEQPLWATTLTFQRGQGFSPVTDAWGPTEELRLDPVTGVLEWRLNPGQADEMLVDTVEGIAALQNGELANGLDDDGNDLIDEPGFCVTRSGDVLLVHLTLEGTESNGFLLRRSWTASVHIRN